MTSSLLSSNPAVNPTRRKKKKRIQCEIPESVPAPAPAPIEWRSDAQQQVYSSKLLQALRHVRQGGGASGPKRVREAADRVLAATARGRTRWSRAILTNRLKLKFMKKSNIVKRQSQVMTVITGGDRLRRKSKLTISRLKSLSLPAVQRKGRVLGKLVPGCRKEPLPVVLEEATDYIAALQMQIRVMRALTERLSVSGSSSSSTSYDATTSGGDGGGGGGGSNPFGSGSTRTRPT